VLVAGDGREEIADLGATEDDGQLDPTASLDREVCDLDRSPEGDGVEEFEGCTDLSVGLPGDLLLLDQVEQVLPDVLLAHFGGRAHVVLGKETRVEQVDLAGQGAVAGEAHVLVHSIAKVSHGVPPWFGPFWTQRPSREDAAFSMGEERDDGGSGKPAVDRGEGRGQGPDPGVGKERARSGRLDPDRPETREATARSAVSFNGIGARMCPEGGSV
jgi:hypothetical protein